MAALLVTLLGLTQGGCYYAHLAGGQWRLWAERESIESLLEGPSLSASDREILALLPALRRYATELGLEADKQYHHLVAPGRDRVLTTVVATEPGHLDAHSFRFPPFGAFPYKGFFDPTLADEEAEELRANGFDVCISAIPAYSTLGWLADPVTGPMLRYGPGVFAEMTLHEWVHATVYVRDDGHFNEGVATFIGQEASVAFFAHSEGPEAGERERERVNDDRAISRVMADARRRIVDLYANERSAADGPVAAARAQIEAETRADLAALSLSTRNPERVAARARLGDACLALAATYEEDLEAYDQRLRALDGDLRRFVDATRAAAEGDDPRAELLAGADATLGAAPPRPAP